MSIHTKFEVVGRRANQRKVPKNLPFRNYKSELLILNVHILGANVRILSLILWLGGQCTDADDSDNADDANNYARRTNHDYTRSFGIVPKKLKTEGGGAVSFPHPIHCHDLKGTISHSKTIV